MGRRWIDDRPLPTIALACLTTGACGPDNGESHPSHWSTLPELRFEVQAEIGGYDAEGVHALGSVRGAALLPGSNEFAVADGSEQEIHYFTRSGGYVRTVGGRGGGPGEFRGIRVLKGVDGGDLCVWDVQQTVTSFDSGGGLRGNARANLDNVEAAFPAFVDFVEDCSFILRDQVGDMSLRDQPEGVRRDSASFVLFDSSGVQVHSLATVEGAARWLENRDGTWGRVDLVFGEDLVAFVSGSHLWIGLTGRLHWRRYDLRTGESTSLESSLPTRRASEEDVEAERQRRLDAIEPTRTGTAAVDGVDLASRLAVAESAEIGAVPARTELPAYDRVVSGWDGAIWLREYPAPEEADARWVLMSADAEFLGQLSLPRTTTVLDASFRWLITGQEDELDAPVVRILRRIG